MLSNLLIFYSKLKRNKKKSFAIKIQESGL